MSEKPRYRVRAGVSTNDAYVNPATRTGRGQQNLASQGGYAFSYWTRNRVQLEAAYRGSWIIGNAVDCIADDMTRAGIDILGLSDTGEDATLQAEISRLGIWSAINDVVKWARLYGGALGIIMIDGQDPNTPLDISTIGKDQFRGIYAIDRWLTVPNYTDLITELGPDVGLPKYYEIVPGDWPFSGQTIHHSRIIRADGIRLPIYQRQYENMWGMSIVERIFDVLTAFDSATVGAAQLVYKAHLRVMKVVGYKQVMGGMNDGAKRGIMAQIDNIRQFQSNEGMSVIDSEDELRADTYTFAGLNDILMQFAQQIAGATQIPMTRLMGQSPAGFSTGDSDIRQYQEGIAQRQERHRPAVHNIIRRFSASGCCPGCSGFITFSSIPGGSSSASSIISSVIVFQEPSISAPAFSSRNAVALSTRPSVNAAVTAVVRVEAILAFCSSFMPHREPNRNVSVSGAGLPNVDW